MQISRKNEELFWIKTKEGLIQISEKGVDIDGLLFSGPGEYERKGIFVEGIAPDSVGTIFVIHSEDINICYAAGISSTLSNEAVKTLGDIDLLILSIGGDKLNPKDAEKTVSTIDPRVVIPAYVSPEINLESALGIKAETLDSYKLKRSDLPVEDRKLVIIS